MAHGVWSSSGDNYSGVVEIGNDYISIDKLKSMLNEVPNVRLVSCYQDTEHSESVSLYFPNSRELHFPKGQDPKKSLCGPRVKPYQAKFERGLKKGPLKNGDPTIRIN